MRCSTLLWAVVAIAGTSCGAAEKKVDFETAELRFVEQLVEAGDPFAAPIILSWLAAEQDGQRLGAGSPRLHLAIKGVERLRLKAGVPWLVQLYGNPTLSYELASWKDGVAIAAIRIDPRYSKQWLVELMGKIKPTANQMPWRQSVAAAAALAEHHDDDDAREFMVLGYQHHPGAGNAVDVLSDEMDGLVMGEMVRCSDVKLREALLELAAKLQGRDKTQAEEVAEQMRVNGLSDAELLKLAETGKGREKRRALAALGWHGPASAVEKLEALAATEGDKGVDGRGIAQIGSAKWAAAEVRGRFGLGKLAIDPPQWEASVEKAVEAPKNAVGPFALRFSGVSRYPHPDGQMRPVMVFYDLAGHAPRMLCHQATEGILEKGRGIARETAVLAWFSADFKECLGIESLPILSGETSEEAYVLIEKTKVTDGETSRNAIVLGKLGKRIVARVPNRTTADGGSAPDSRLSRALERLLPGQVIQARMEQMGNLTMLEWVGAYRPWMKAKVIGMKEDQIELEVARRKIVCVLPVAGDGYEPSMSKEMLEEMKPGWEVKVQFAEGLDLEAKEALRLRDIALDGYVSRRINDSFVMVHCGRASLQGSYRDGVYRGNILTGGRDSESSRLRSGLVAVLDRKAAPAEKLTPEKLAALRQARNIRAPYTRGQAEKANALMATVDSARSTTARARAQQEIYMELARVSGAVEEEEARQIKQVKEILSAEEYEAVVKAGTR